MRLQEGSLGSGGGKQKCHTLLGNGSDTGGPMRRGARVLGVENLFAGGSRNMLRCASLRYKRARQGEKEMVEGEQPGVGRGAEAMARGKTRFLVNRGSYNWKSEGGVGVSQRTNVWGGNIDIMAHRKKKLLYRGRRGVKLLASGRDPAFTKQGGGHSHKVWSALAF